MEWICKCSNDLVTHTASSPTMYNCCLTLPRSYPFDGYHQKSGIVQMKSSTCQPGQTFGLSVSWRCSLLLRSDSSTAHTGVTLWELFTYGEFPYSEWSAVQVVSEVCHEYRLPQPQICRNRLYNVMEKCWSKNNTDRPSFLNLVQQLEEMATSPDTYVNQVSVVYSKSVLCL